MTTREDIEELIARVAMEDRKAFDALYSATSAKLFGICLRVLNDRAAAEEALQEVYVRIWHRADRYRANGYSPMTWLITVTRNHAIDRLRARRAVSGKMAGAVPEDLPAREPGPEALAAHASDMALLKGCLEELDAQKADAVRGAYLQGETYQELSDRLGIPLNTIRTWLRRSLLSLRACMSQ
ncbi:MAG: sigma-70 family RNA polymerase sigma factor [Shimia sp.]